MSFENESQIPKTSIQFAVVEGNVDPIKAQTEASFSIGFSISVTNEHTSGDLTSVKDWFFVSILLNARETKASH